VARVCQDFLNQNYISVLPWPALLPDLSPIEQLWDEIVIRVRHEWNNIPQAFMHRLVICIGEAVVAARGGHACYWNQQTSMLHDNLCLSMICSDNDVDNFCWYCHNCCAHMNLKYTIFVEFFSLCKKYWTSSPCIVSFIDWYIMVNPSHHDGYKLKNFSFN
jgi:hypothetical protein